MREGRATRFAARDLLPCPFLPPFRAGLDYRHLRAHRGGQGGNIIPAALEYAQTLWMAELPARSILALTRALYAMPPHAEDAAYPVPYAALAWICQTHAGRGAGFLGNPRISFQHQAQRMRLAPVEQRRARAWAAWFIAARALPDFPDDVRSEAERPTGREVAASLRQQTSPAEADLWQGVVSIISNRSA